MRMSTLFRYASLVITGLAILMLCSVVRHTDLAPSGEYRFSAFLRDSYGIVGGCLVFLAGLAAGYLLRLNPWLTGLSLVLIFPLTSLYEATVYRGSHNLIPFELAVHFLFALPGISGAYLGRLLWKRLSKRGQI